MMRTQWRLSLVALIAVMSTAKAADSPELIWVRKIWDQAPHNAFTDLVRFRGKWFCVFREGSGHVPGTDGVIRVIASDDGETWQSAALLAENGIDLRDPKLSATPDGRLMLTAGAAVYAPGDPGTTRKVTGHRSRVAFSTDGSHWGPLHPVLSEGEWLWRVTWHERCCYGVTYDADPKREFGPTLYQSSDGLNWSRIAEFDPPRDGNETTLRFLDDGRMVAMARRDDGNRRCWIGSSRPPFTRWEWNETAHHVGGPDFIVLPNGDLWGAGRDVRQGAQTSLGPITAERRGYEVERRLVRGGLLRRSFCQEISLPIDRFHYQPFMTLPSGGDTSYPGMVWHDGCLWMSYYSSHEGKTSIYLAKTRVPRQ